MLVSKEEKGDRNKRKRKEESEKENRKECEEKWNWGRIKGEFNNNINKKNINITFHTYQQVQLWGTSIVVFSSSSDSSSF